MSRACPGGPRAAARGIARSFLSGALQADGCVVDLVLCLGWLILFYEACFIFWMLCSISFCFHVLSFYNKSIKMIKSHSSSTTELCITSKDATHSQGCIFSLHNESDVKIVVVVAVECRRCGRCRWCSQFVDADAVVLLAVLFGYIIDRSSRSFHSAKMSSNQYLQLLRRRW